MIITDYHSNFRGYSQPRSIVKIDGKSTWFSSWTVNLNSTHIADDFTVELPFKITKNVPQGYLVNSPEFTSFLFTNSNVLIEIFVGYPKNPYNYQDTDLTRIMYGYMDTPELDLSEQGETVKLTGRNQVAPFLDNKTTQKYQNMVSSAIAQMLASNHGMQCVTTPTYTLTGQYYNGDSVQLDKDITEWDLLTFLADQENYEMRVRDNTLYFGPFEQVVGEVVNQPLNYTWGQNVQDMTISRSPHAAKNLVIDVESYDSKKGKHIRASASKNFKNAQTSYHQRYFFAGLTHDQCQKKAITILNQLSRLEVVGSLKVVGDPLLTVDRQIAIFGTGAYISDNYYIRKATHSFDISQGYMCDLTISNLLLDDERTGGL